MTSKADGLWCGYAVVLDSALTQIPIAMAFLLWVQSQTTATEK